MDINRDKTGDNQEVKIKRDEDKGYDSTRKAVIGHKDIKLDYFEEAFTSEWSGNPIGVGI